MSIIFMQEFNKIQPIARASFQQRRKRFIIACGTVLIALTIIIIIVVFVVIMTIRYKTQISKSPSIYDPH
jgi:uncharacterized protein YqhQ